MYLRRKIDEFLDGWKRNPSRKPLIVSGARQIGKTESIRHFAEKNYSVVIEINFVKDKKFKGLTDDGYDVSNLIKKLSLLNPSFKFIPNETLIFFDEITEFPDIATSLKFFREDGRFDVICSGSMLGLNYQRIEHNSVGNKTDYVMHSMDFEEFLWAKGYAKEAIENLLAHMCDLSPFSQLEMDVFHAHFLDYAILGGMPSVVKGYIEKGTFEGVLDEQKQLIKDYKEDMRKYAEGLDQTRILNVFNRVTPQLAQENKKFGSCTFSVGRPLRRGMNQTFRTDV